MLPTAVLVGPFVLRTKPAVPGSARTQTPIPTTVAGAALSARLITPVSLTRVTPFRSAAQILLCVATARCAVTLLTPRVVVARSAVPLPTASGMSAPPELGHCALKRGARRLS